MTNREESNSPGPLHSPSTASAVVEEENKSNSSEQRRMKTIYLVRHAEATHNIKEREAVARARGNGCVSKEELENARRAVLNDEALKDAPLSPDGTQMVRTKSSGLLELSESLPKDYPYPEIVFVSPLRRAIMTATELWYHVEPRPKFVALEVLREKRTGFFADERSPVETLIEAFPHVDFTDLVAKTISVPTGEDNFAVRERGRIFLEETLVNVDEGSIAVVTHKGWLREFRHVIRVLVDDGSLQIDIDVDQWDQTLFGNAEIRIAQFSWEGTMLRSIVSRSVDTIIESTKQAVNTLFEKITKRFSETSVKDSVAPMNDATIDSSSDPPSSEDVVGEEVSTITKDHPQETTTPINDADDDVLIGGESDDEPISF